MGRLIVRYGSNWYYKISEAAKIAGVHVDTLRRWDRLGWLKPVRTPSGHRLYSTKMINRVVKERLADDKR